MLFSPVVGRSGKNVYLPAVNGRDRRAGVGGAIQFFAADLWECQITED
jgi:hypothetical protein